MKTTWFSRIVLAVVVGGAALLSAGCEGTQKSASAPIPPNWYDSYFDKAGTLAFPDVPDTYSVASPQNPSNQ